MSVKSNKRLKFGLLLILVFQTTGCVLLLRYSRHRTSVKSSENYLVSTTVVSSEIIKVLTSLCVLLFQTGSLMSCLQLLHKEIILNHQESLKSAVPALSYTVQNNLLFVALSHLDSVTYQVTYQLKILVTAIFSVLMLHKRLSSIQWLSLVMLMAGVIAIQLPDSSSTKTEQQNDLIGLLCVLISCFLSGFTGVYFEKILKKGDQSLWIRNFQLSFMSSILALINAFAQDHSKIFKSGFFFGYTPLTWTVILIHAFGGFIVAFVMKYADNILKGFATSISIVISTIISFYIMDDFSPQPYFIIGAPMVLIAVILYGY
ncbi:UDP-N-acetylglucosamine transporter [Tetranychus urticae]|uniref:UDP-N-acetylglucosamine transporter n=1 Tax=Tetranychus urticae TaxID=32264 RepID=T1JXY0_TETUR|nr:UDP-N-acetylglucosamine transporter [Tetranychus urticae]